MGLDIRTAEFLLHCRGLGVDFTGVCTLGHQTVMLSPGEAKRLSRWLGGVETQKQAYADFFFKSLGAQQPHSMDVSAYQGADILHNLNAELPGELHGRFSCLIDGGTLEHIFDFKEALKSCMQMVRPGGHLVICQMANNCMGHGFYQFSPEVFYSALTPENGYEICFMALNENGVWYEPFSPKQARDRIQARTREETYIYVVAKRISDVVPFAVAPHQADYESNLGLKESSQVTTSNGASGLQKLRRKAGQFKERYLPWLWDWQSRYNRHRLTKFDELGNARRFRKIGRRLAMSFATLSLMIGVELSGGAGQFVMALELL